MDHILDHDRIHRIPLDTYMRQRWRHPEYPIAMVGMLRARVNHGRWIVDCPTSGCNSAAYASLRDRRFICSECGKGYWRVMFPPDRVEIEDLLVKRPLVQGTPATRNWEVGETVTDLRRENWVRGIV